MTALLNIALDFYQGKYQAEEFMMEYLNARRNHKDKQGVTHNQAMAEWKIFSACDLFLPSLGLHGVGGEHDINETQFRQEVEQALKSVGMI